MDEHSTGEGLKKLEQDHKWKAAFNEGPETVVLLAQYEVTLGEISHVAADIFNQKVPCGLCKSKLAQSSYFYNVLW